MPRVVRERHRRRDDCAMIGFSELLIVILGFSLPALYLFICSRFIRQSEQAAPELKGRH